MSNVTRVSFIIGTIFCLTILGCSPSSNETELSEQDVAIAFFDAIYNKKDLKKALLLSSSKLKNEVNKYRTAKHLARKLLNMSFDSVKLETSSTNTKILNEFSTQVTLTVLFTGQRDGNTFKDYRKVGVIKENDIWLVDKI